MAANALSRFMIRPLRSQIVQLRCPQRTIHSTPTLQKRKAKSATDDLFSEDTLVEDELIKESSPVFSAKGPSVPVLDSSVQQTPLPSTEKTKGRKRRVLPSAVKLERFHNILSFVEPRLGRNPTTERPLMRKRSWLSLLDFVENKDQMQQIIDLFPKNKDAKGEFPEKFADAFTRRCHELSCPQLALTVFGDFAKYNLPLTLTAGRWLIHSLYVQHPISQTFLAVSYFPAYNLPQVSEDLPSAVMIAAACYNHKHKTDETVKVADALLPHIRNMWTEGHTKLGSAKTLEEARINKWVAWGLKRLNKAVMREKEQFVVPPEIVPARIKIDGPSPAPHLNVQV